MGTSTIGAKRILVMVSLYAGVLFPLALFVWKLHPLSLTIAIAVISLSYFLTIFLLWLRFSLTEKLWLKLWGVFAPFLITSIFAIPHLPIFPLVPILPLVSISL